MGHHRNLCMNLDMRDPVGYPSDAYRARLDGKCGPDGLLWEEYIKPAPKPSWWQRLAGSAADGQGR